MSSKISQQPELSAIPADGVIIVNSAGTTYRYALGAVIEIDTTVALSKPLDIASQYITFGADPSNTGEIRLSVGDKVSYKGASGSSLNALVCGDGGVTDRLVVGGVAAGQTTDVRAGSGAQVGLSAHDGSSLHTVIRVGTSGGNPTFAAYGVTLTTQPADPGALTNSTGGSADGTLAAVSGSGADSTINDNFTELHAKYEALRSLLQTLGFAA